MVEKQKSLEQGLGLMDAAQAASDTTVLDQLPAIAIPKRFTQTMKEIWELQDRLEFKVGRRPLRLLEHKRFRAAYDFLLLREKEDPKLTEPADWWTRVQGESPDVQRDMLKLLDRHPKQPRRRKKRRRNPSNLRTGSKRTSLNLDYGDGQGCVAFLWITNWLRHGWILVNNAATFKQITRSPDNVKGAIPVFAGSANTHHRGSAEPCTMLR